MKCLCPNTSDFLGRVASHVHFWMRLVGAVRPHGSSKGTSPAPLKRHRRVCGVWFSSLHPRPIPPRPVVADMSLDRGTTFCKSVEFGPWPSGDVNGVVYDEYIISTVLKALQGPSKGSRSFPVVPPLADAIADLCDHFDCARPPANRSCRNALRSSALAASRASSAKCS
jgi:hypothetical protein